MRALLIPIALAVGGLLAIDAFSFHGDYRRAVWQEAKYQGQKINYEVRHALRKLGL